MPTSWYCYIDIIVSRNNYIDFINELTKFKFVIEAISWWCHCTTYNEKNLGCPHGYGGPKSKYFEGWYSERSHDFDEIDQNDIDELGNDFNETTVKKINNKALNIINNKQTISYEDGTFHEFKKDICLTPGLWVRVPDDWVNSFSL